ncbi:MAG: DNA mismatch repair endonuclease MutH [Legionellaceae bacterium]|nr:DNA mismatch repair endonuclease MutH [Legionellaceae bacterium]
MDEDSLQKHCDTLAGITLAELALLAGLPLPLNMTQGKGFLGMALERVLGTTAGNASLPDFHHLGIELKTLPIGTNHKPLESTYVTMVPLKIDQACQWRASICYHKLQKVLFVPFEGDRDIPFAVRRLGAGFLWSPSAEEEAVLENDWREIMDYIIAGRIDEIDARMGLYLQVRPKAAHGKVLTWTWNEQGEKVQTLPRGFYLRSCFTQKIFLQQEHRA